MPDPAQPQEQFIELPAEGYGSLDYWLDQIQGSQDKRKEYKLVWDKNIQSYLSKPLQSLPEHDTVTVPKDFSNVERKKADLFFQLPEVHLVPKMPGLEDAVSVFQAVLNHKLGSDGVDAFGMMSEVTFDALCPSGLLVSKIGYESFQDGMKDVQVGEQVISPEQPNVGAILGLGATTPAQTAPVMQPAPNIVHERWFWERVSPASVLIPADFSGSNYDHAPWLGFEFEDDWEVLKQRFNLPDDLDMKVTHGDNDDTKIRSEVQSSADHTTKKGRGYELWYRASVYDPTVKHPEKFRYLVVLDGVPIPVRHLDSPYQSEDLATGQLLGLMGNPIHVGALRYVSDTAYPPSEVTIGRQQCQELNKGRTQQMLQRERSTPKMWADIGRMGGADALKKIERNAWQSIIPIPGADVNNLPIGELPRSAYPQENFRFDEVIERDLRDIWAFGPNQLGQQAEGRQTATETKNIQSNVSARMDYERKQLIRYYVRGVEKLGALIQKFADQQDFVEILGPEGDKRLQAWDKSHIAGRFVYDAKPDSAMRVDAAQDFRDMIDMYNMLAKDPHVNRVELLTRLTRMKNIDPARLIIPQLPEKGPEPPSIAFTCKGEDLDPRSPSFPIWIELLAQSGYKISPQAIQLAQIHAQAQAQVMSTVNATSGQEKVPSKPEEHGGTAPKADRVASHQSEITGQLSGPSTKAGS